MNDINIEEPKHLAGQLLVAMPGLRDPRFTQAVIYLCEHSSEGAMGIVINQPMELPLEQMFRQLDLECPEQLRTQPLLLGGPVQQQRGFILHSNTIRKWQSTVVVNDQVSITASMDIIEAIASKDGPSESLVALGYAGWSAGQLDQELLDNAWLTAPADAEFLFDTPFEKRANLAAARVGIDLAQLSNSVGHA